MVTTAHPISTEGPLAPRLTVLFANEPSGIAGSGGGEPLYTTLQHLLSPLGVNLVTATTGRQALHLMESSTVHVAVLDHRLPQLGGLQVLKLLREHLAKSDPRHPTADGGPSHCPATILLADHLTTPLLHEALGMSVFTVLAKPVNYPQLLDALARAMKRYHNSQWPAPAGNQ